VTALFESDSTRTRFAEIHDVEMSLSAVAARLWAEGRSDNAANLSEPDPRRGDQRDTRLFKVG